ncbi:MAG TPA: hypothetical protein VL049_06975, partial [Candidatus Dormibacteraeota bacterium]|nr:hypothetical protein [Candidatus Dormibacteraeota bacterium]
MGSRAQARAVAAPVAAPSAPGAAAATMAADAGTPPNAAPPPWELLAPLRAGAALGAGWQVAALSPVQAGSCVLTLAHDSGR